MEELTSGDFEDVFESFTEETRALYLPDKTPEYVGKPAPLDFYRNWIAPNIPVIFKDCLDNWPAITKWNLSYFREKLGENAITVAVTPNGFADAVYDNRFVLPEERQMKFINFLDEIESPSRNSGIFYIQKQNGNFIEEFPELHQDAAIDISWASTAFGKQPDAVNFWMGDARAVTSLHKDHYENIYCMISGEKTFTLYPPTDLAYIPYHEYKLAMYHQNRSGVFQVIDDPSSQTVPWIPIDPLKPDLKQYPNFAKAKSITCTLRSGDILYLPSLWFHHVQQSHAAIALNFWYDMEYDIKYSYFKFMENIVGGKFAAKKKQK